MCASLLGLIVSNCEKPTGISRDRTKRISLKPTESPQEPTENRASRQRVPAKAEKPED
ncbi:hypothetical protein AA0113_g6047 [Alternaria arborescens]|uniref:Uncharacterized protein n=1 Tax=Alternaria arborescens TaxID=156630 RepID=A0A4Q4S0U7_9PLEO|nr:hypothetical protein AA0111_g5268 [Alternaria arborescens]RYN64608.1 hypothetical protein AA0118_g3883 [Alternaria tenuissima]RYN33929.1 hypothetical protein AA0112_g5526 [Alternaria arborescens]RYN86932.1 hypothetical protein AA0120_g7801 [Alternaria tenuissima]RYO31122.1 hypothetical protein AA0111_g5268 [Alternaria arborescens]RYO63400.1 hypothetical protein AA0113_g6047 [Alternaria arborescens]